jgi:hypothetical protein
MMPANSQKEGVMQTKTKARAIEVLRKAREIGRYKLREISAETGVSQSALCQMGRPGYYFSDDLALKIIDGIKRLGRKIK